MQPYFTGDKIKIFIPKLNKFNKAIALYIISVLKIAFTNFSWGSSSYNVGVLNEVIIPLPTQNDELAFSFMEQFINAVQKLVIKDVVVWTDKKIEAYRKIVGIDTNKI